MLFRVVIIGSLLKIGLAVSCLLVPDPGDDVSAFPIWLNVANLLAFSLAAGLLIGGGRGDQRAQSLGMAFLAFATIFTDRLLLRATAPGYVPLMVAAQIAVSTRVDAALPLCLWIFARDFPQPAPAGAARAIPRIALPLTAATSAVLATANLLTLPWLIRQTDVPGWLQPFLARSAAEYWTPLILLILPALIYIVSKERSVRLPERRRLRLFVCALFAGWAPMLVDVLLEALVPAFRAWAVDHRPLTGLLAYPPLLSLPFLTAYAVLVDRALDVHLIIRNALQYALARYTAYGLVAIPFAGALIYLYANRGATILDVLSGRRLAVLGLTTAAAAVAARFGPKLFDAIDRHFFREQYDARRTLADLIGSSRRAASTADLAVLLNDQIDRALHVDTNVLFAEAGSHRLAAPGDPARSLPAGAALAVLVGGSADPLDVDLDDSALRRLPEAEKRWLRDGQVRLLVPLLRVDGALIGIIALSEKRSELPFSADDRQLLRDVAASAALALDNMLIRSSPPPTPAAVVAHEGTPPLSRSAENADAGTQEAAECLRCGAVQSQAERTCRHCGSEVARASVPLVIGGKFHIVRRLAKGGMSIVYVARDMDLHRDVAVKTLPPMLLDQADRLRREARAMASASHLNLAQIFGFETWRGTPILIVEYLSGGTLQDRLRDGRLAEAEVVAIGLALANGLDRLHGSGLLHRDIKPSNVGFTGDRIPKLLDFGLAKLIQPPPHAVSAPKPSQRTDDEDATRQQSLGTVTGSLQMPGTPAYMSPEALRGLSAQPSFDLWALAIVLYEGVCGRNPITSDNLFVMLDTVVRADIPDVRTFAPDCTASLAGFFAEALHLDEQRRPASAREFRARLLDAATAAW